MLSSIGAMQQIHQEQRDRIVDDPECSGECSTPQQTLISSIDTKHLIIPPNSMDKRLSNQNNTSFLHRLQFLHRKNSCDDCHRLDRSNYVPSLDSSITDDKCAEDFCHLNWLLLNYFVIICDECLLLHKSLNEKYTKIIEENSNDELYSKNVEEKTHYDNNDEMESSTSIIHRRHLSSMRIQIDKGKTITSFFNHQTRIFIPLRLLYASEKSSHFDFILHSLECIQREEINKKIYEFRNFHMTPQKSHKSKNVQEIIKNRLEGLKEKYIVRSTLPRSMEEIRILTNNDKRFIRLWNFTRDDLKHNENWTTICGIFESILISRNYLHILLFIHVFLSQFSMKEIVGRIRFRSLRICPIISCIQNGILPEAELLCLSGFPCQEALLYLQNRLIIKQNMFSGLSSLSNQKRKLNYLILIQRFKYYLFESVIILFNCLMIWRKHKKQFRAFQTNSWQLQHELDMNELTNFFHYTIDINEKFSLLNDRYFDIRSKSRSDDIIEVNNFFKHNQSLYQIIGLVTDEVERRFLPTFILHPSHHSWKKLKEYLYKPEMLLSSVSDSCDESTLKHNRNLLCRYAFLNRNTELDDNKIGSNNERKEMRGNHLENYNESSPTRRVKNDRFNFFSNDDTFHLHLNNDETNDKNNTGNLYDEKKDEEIMEKRKKRRNKSNYSQFSAEELLSFIVSLLKEVYMKTITQQSSDNKKLFVHNSLKKPVLVKQFPTPSTSKPTDTMNTSEQLYDDVYDENNSLSSVILTSSQSASIDSSTFKKYRKDKFHLYSPSRLSIVTNQLDKTENTVRNSDYDSITSYNEHNSIDSLDELEYMRKESIPSEKLASTADGNEKYSQETEKKIRDSNSSNIYSAICDGEPMTDRFRSLEVKLHHMEKKFDVLLNQYNTLINQRPKTSDKSSTSSFHRSSSFSNYRSNEKNIMRLKEKRESNEKEDDERIDETIMEMMDVKKFEKEKNRIEEKSRIVTTSLINLFNLLQNNDTEMKERDVTDSKVRAITNENYHQLSLNVHTAVVHLTNVLQSATVVDANRLGPIVQSRSTAMLSAASLLSYSDEGPLDDDTIYSIIYDIARLMKDVIHTLQSQPSNDYVVQ